MLTHAFQPNALHACLRAFEQHVELVGGELGLGESGLASHLANTGVLADPMLIDDLACRVIRFGELRQCVA